MTFGIIESLSFPVLIKQLLFNNHYSMIITGSDPSIMDSMTRQYSITISEEDFPLLESLSPSSLSLTFPHITQSRKLMFLLTLRTAIIFYLLKFIQIIFCIHDASAMERVKDFLDCVSCAILLLLINLFIVGIFRLALEFSCYLTCTHCTCTLCTLVMDVVHSFISWCNRILEN